jgi:hypothetical protein
VASLVKHPIIQVSTFNITSAEILAREVSKLGGTLAGRINYIDPLGPPEVVIPKLRRVAETIAMIKEHLKNIDILVGDSSLLPEVRELAEELKEDKNNG